MNIHRLVSRHIAVVNPPVPVQIQRSNGYDTLPGGKRQPHYESPVSVVAQVQSATAGDIQQLDGLNIQGERRVIYLNGNWNGTVREDGKGGDLITLPDGTIWLVAQVLENFGSEEGWVKVAVTRQMVAAP